MKKFLLITALSFFFLADFTGAQYIYPKRELRGAWIATVANIDWPTSNHETPGRQIRELVNIFDKLKAAGINTVYFQVRTECDALYKSSYEPWSYWLTGKQGQAPNPFYDPLAFAISEAHSRGMELHAWFNPYRAVKTTGEYQIAKNHVSVLHPEWILDFKDYKMLNPGLPAVRDYIAKIVADVVRRYDVDGIHFDDYFYPYSPKISNQDEAAFRKYNDGIKDIDDWRRHNINQMVAEVYDTIMAINPHVKFGISPFGIVENKYAGTHGFESYKAIYCDPLTWIKDKTVDYVLPQLYWEIGNKAADFSKLLPWWSSVVDGRQLFVGSFSTKMAGSDYKGSPSELEDQIRLSRQIIRVGGIVFFSAKSITDNYSHFSDSLKLYFKYPSLIPVMNWKDSVPPEPPTNLHASVDTNGIRLTWDRPAIAPDGDSAYRFVIYRFSSPDEIDLDNATHIIRITDNANDFYLDISAETNSPGITYVVTSLDRMNNESKGATVSFTIGKK